MCSTGKMLTEKLQNCNGFFTMNFNSCLVTDSDIKYLKTLTRDVLIFILFTCVFLFFSSLSELIY